MLWLEHPPIWRWLGATLLVAVAAWSEFAPPTTIPHPYAAALIPAGTALTDDLFEWREVDMAGVAPIEPHGVAVVDILQGDPLVGSMIGEVTVPDGWLVIGAPLPHHARPGKRATAVVVPSTPGGGTETFPALVVGSSISEPFGEASGQLAVPAEWMPIAAAAVLEGRLVVGVAAER